MELKWEEYLEGFKLTRLEFVLGIFRVPVRLLGNLSLCCCLVCWWVYSPFPRHGEDCHLYFIIFYDWRPIRGNTTLEKESYSLVWTQRSKYRSHLMWTKALQVFWSCFCWRVLSYWHWPAKRMNTCYLLDFYTKCEVSIEEVICCSRAQYTKIEDGERERERIEVICCSRAQFGLVVF